MEKVCVVNVHHSSKVEEVSHVGGADLGSATHAVVSIHNKQAEDKEGWGRGSTALSDIRERRHSGTTIASVRFPESSFEAVLHYSHQLQDHSDSCGRYPPALQSYAGRWISYMVVAISQITFSSPAG